MVHYHGLPITPDVACVAAIQGGHAFVSFARPEQLAIAMEVSQSYALDNGAFSAWRAGREVKDWSDYHKMVAHCARTPTFDFAVIPDVIEGSEEENDALIDSWPWARKPWIGAPVWHMHESFERLERLALKFPRVCLGSSGEYATIGTDAWWRRMGEAMNVVCDREGRPITKLHGLRMLAPKIFGNLPLSSADSTNIARNIGLDSKWPQAYTPINKAARAVVLRGRIEAHKGADWWDKTRIFRQNELLSSSAKSRG